MKISLRWFCSPLAESCLKWPLEQGVVFTDELHNIEKHWKDQIKEQGLKRADIGLQGSQNTKYILSMFPYPSGKLHMGHLRVYTISDVLSRYFSLKGYHVIHPIGWDAFGLPAENAAIEHGVDPESWTYSNIDSMREQLLRTGVQFDWDREIFTCKPDYFKWTQWIFLQLYKHGLVRRTMAEVFWDPVDKTVLAAEQVDKEGRSWRSGAVVEKQLRCQWAIETPKLAKRMMHGLSEVKNDWKEVANIQANWIGKCDVFRFVLPIEGKVAHKYEQLFDLRIKNPLELISAKFLVVTPNHALAEKNSSRREDYLIQGVHVFNFLNGIHMPIVVSCKNNDLQDAEYFMNARMGQPEKSSYDEKIAESFNFNAVELPKISLTVEEIQAKAKEGNYGGYETSRTLRDWIVSRQRSWGTPIPMALDDEGTKALPISEDQLPLLSKSRSQKIAHDGFSSGFGIVETDTLDTFFDSSWYFLRYLDPNNSKELVDKKIAAEQMPVDVYVGGIEHADVHLFFARFISYFLCDLGVLKNPEPVKRLIPQGYVLGKTFLLEDSGAFIDKEDVEERKDPSTKNSTYVQKKTEMPVTMSYLKMSKSKGNGVDPLQVVESDGIDLTRLQLLDSAAPQQLLQWGSTQESDVRGIKRFLNRLAKLINVYVHERIKLGNAFHPLSAKEESVYRDIYNLCVRNLSVALEITNLHNAAFEQLQTAIKYIKKAEPDAVGRSAEIERCLHAIVIMLQVFAPHLAAELWIALSKAPKIQADLWNSLAPISHQKWPMIDDDCILELVLKVNGEVLLSKVRRKEIEPMDTQEIIAFAKQNAQPWFFELLRENSLRIKQIHVEKNCELNVQLHVEMEDDVTKESLREVLKQIWKAKSQLRKEKRKQKAKDVE